MFGASGGIGSCLAKRLAQHPGASIALVGRSGEKLEALKASLGPAAAASYVHVADVTDSKQVGRVPMPGVAPTVVSRRMRCAHACMALV